MQVSSRAMTYQPTENFQFKNDDFQASKLDPLKNERLHPGYCDGSVQTSRDCSIFAQCVYNSKMSGEYWDDITLGMDIEIDNEEYSSDIREFDDENEQIDDGGDGEAAAAAADMPRGYQHEPEPGPRQAEAGDLDAMAGLRLA